VILFALLAVTFFLLGAGDLAGATGVSRLGGYFGLATAAVAWYTCAAGVLTSTFGRPPLPNPPAQPRLILQQAARCPLMRESTDSPTRSGTIAFSLAAMRTAVGAPSPRCAGLRHGR
jgi:hypothetical protein